MGGHGGLNILPQVRFSGVVTRMASAFRSLRCDWPQFPSPPRPAPRPTLPARPQKRWNVYGREQRLKVARDEAKYEEEQAAVRERAEAADRERRRQLLLQRARQRYGVRLAGEGRAAGLACLAAGRAAVVLVTCWAGTPPATRCLFNPPLPHSRHLLLCRAIRHSRGPRELPLPLQH